jgi:cytoskeletal protein RodZ
MRELGQILQEAREAKGLSLEQVESATHMRVKFLRALELGQPELFPTPLQMRGFLRNYARYLGLDPDPLLQRYAAPNGKNGRGAVQVQPDLNGEWRAMFRRPADISRRRASFFSWDLLISVVILAAVAGFVLWYGSQLISGTTPSLPFNLGALMGTPAATATNAAIPAGALTQPPPEIEPTDAPSEAPPAEATQLPAPAVPEGVAQLDVTATERTWVRVTVDGNVEYEGLMTPDEQKSWQGQESIQLLTGNAAGLNVTFNVQPVGALGARGQVVQRAWTPTGEVASTPTPAP